MNLTESQSVLAISKAVQEMNRISSAALGGPSIGHWEDISDLEREDMIYFVGAILSGQTPEFQHEYWVVEQTMQGWTLGPEYDPINKKDPRLVHWKDYPEQTKQQMLTAEVLIRKLLCLIQSM